MKKGRLTLKLLGDKGVHDDGLGWSEALLSQQTYRINVLK